MFRSEDIQMAGMAAGRLVGDPHPLTACLGSPGWLGELAPGVPTSLPPVRDRDSLERFLNWYRTVLLLPVELPVIRRAWEHQMRYEPRELLALDLGLAADPRLRPFAAASRAVGRTQLRRLLPMRDQRLVRRYYEAVEAGRANGWHLLVYGVVLGLFALPLRQGLLHYARQTTRVFIERAAGPLELRVPDMEVLLDRTTAPLVRDLGGVLDTGQRPTLSICR